MLSDEKQDGTACLPDQAVQLKRIPDFTGLSYMSRSAFPSHSLASLGTRHYNVGGAISHE